MSAKKVGEISHYFDHISVGIIKAASPIKVGDKVHFKGHTTDFEQEIKEMQLDHESIPEAKKGQEVGVKVKDHVREGDEVFLAE
ncbi:MAG: translation elongation factor-like protein [Patescibacteria group bacterium]|jgi:putative protease|nr:translation elongation factor-like protein [Patescibacteria group bacterium]